MAKIKKTLANSESGSSRVCHCLLDWTSGVRNNMVLDCHYSKIVESGNKN